MTNAEEAVIAVRPADYSLPVDGERLGRQLGPATVRISAGGRHALALVRRRPADRYAMRACPMQ